MTYYENAVEMKKLCSKISQVCKIQGEYGLSNFYAAASEGYEEQCKNYSEEEANKLAEAEKEDALRELIAYVKEEQEKTATQIVDVLISLKYPKDKAEEVSLHFKRNELTEEDQKYIDIVSEYIKKEAENN